MGVPLAQWQQAVIGSNRWCLLIVGDEASISHCSLALWTTRHKPFGWT